MRPRQWAHFAVLPLAGFDPALTLMVMIPALLRGVVLAGCVLAFGYLLNALSDRRLDRDRRKNPLVDLVGSTRPHWLTLALLASVAIGLAATGPALVLVATLIALGAGTVYSVGPRLKGLPGICTLLNVACFAPLLYVGLGAGPVDAARWALGAAFACLLLQNQLVHEAVDADEDRAGGLRTTFLVAGPRGTAALAFIAGIGLAAASAWLCSVRNVNGLVVLHALPYLTVVPILLARFGSDPARMRRLRHRHRIGSALSGVLLFAGLLFGS